MTEATDTPGVLTGKDRSPVLPILVLLISAALGALTSWMVRVDERLYGVVRDVPTRAEIQVLRSELNGRLDRIDATLATALARPQSIPHP